VDVRKGYGNYDREPCVEIGDVTTWIGDAAWHELAAASAASPPLIVLDTYPGTDLVALARDCARVLPAFEVIDATEWALPEPERDQLLAPFLTDDRVFGYLTRLPITSLLDPARVERARREVAQRAVPTVVVGWGATLADPAHEGIWCLVDMARWELQLRMRAGEPNWSCTNYQEDVLRKFKRGYFVDWRTADEHKRRLFDEVDYMGEANSRNLRVLTSGDFGAALWRAARRPLRVVPYFDPGVWGGDWMREVMALPDNGSNYAWCFDCVPEENSLLLQTTQGVRLEFPALDLVLHEPLALLGAKTYARFGAEFPIRFDMLDTMHGGNLSLQVHPRTDYIVRQFGMTYTQDESYYLLDAAPDARVYLGLREGVDPDQMLGALREAQDSNVFDAEAFVNTLPAHPHDHFAIPAGTVHCSGANSMVLEISATPYIFTFKMWDWGRLGLDGVPRPVHLEHARRNIAWERTTSWVLDQLTGPAKPIASGPGWCEERTGLHDLEFIETRRHWFTTTMRHDTKGTVNVLNLVAGPAALVTSPEDAFAPFVVHYAETFIIPASVGPYRVSPLGEGESWATIKAYVRGTEIE
jgi:mannose-6-phosphate isomerase class I